MLNYKQNNINFIILLMILIGCDYSYDLNDEEFRNSNGSKSFGVVYQKENRIVTYFGKYSISNNKLDSSYLIHFLYDSIILQDRRNLRHFGFLSPDSVYLKKDKYANLHSKIFTIGFLFDRSRIVNYNNLNFRIDKYTNEQQPLMSLYFSEKYGLVGLYDYFDRYALSLGDDGDSLMKLIATDFEFFYYFTNYKNDTLLEMFNGNSELTIDDIFIVDE